MAADTPDRLTDALRSVADALAVLEGYDDDALVDALKRLEVVPADVATGTNRIGSAAARVAADADPDSDDPACSFCFKGRSQVPFVVAGPGVAICNECVDTCNRILGSFDTGPSSRDPQPGAFARLARWLTR